MSLVHYLDRDPKKDDRPALPTPREMIAYLNTHIIGQDQAKRDLAEAFYCHYIDLSARDEMIESGKLLRDSYRVYGSANTLMIGPTGCGKTEIVERLAEFADVPFSAHSAATMVPNGIVGESTDDMFYAPYVTCGREIGPVERSMVFIDEIDKMAVRRGDGQNNHPYGGSVQKALLRIVEGTRITLALEGTASGPKGLINTGRMFFVAGGAFTGILEIVKKRVIGASRPGFRASLKTQERAVETEAELFDRLIPDDLIEYGFMPELVPRFRNITVLYPLTTGDLYRILTETPDSALQQQIRLFEAHSVELVITKEALEAVCEKAHGDRSGARGLDLHIRRSLRKLSPTELERDRVRQVVIDEECVAANGASPQITFHKKSDCQATPASKLRESAVQFKNGGESEEISGASVGTSPWLLDQAIEQLKNSSLDWANATGLARDWWRNFEEAYSDRRTFVHSLALELSNRNATINEFFELTIGADTTDVGTRLIFFDYQRRLTREKGGIRSLFRPYSGFQDDEYETGGFESDLYLPNDDDFFDDEDRFDADPCEGESGDEDETD